MTLIKSISGIRGTIGGKVSQALTPIDIVKFTYAYAEKMRERLHKGDDYKYKVVVGRDARISGPMVEDIVCATLVSCGVDVIKIGLASTPTTEMAVTFSKADGGIIITASHNPKQWNALKLLNEKGEFLNDIEGKAILAAAEKEDFDFAQVQDLGHIQEQDFTQAHIDAILALDTVDTEAIKKANLSVVLDAVNSVGAIIIPKMLSQLGVKCYEVNCEVTGDFSHNPEPLPENLLDLSSAVKEHKADMGISVDPDVDRLAFMSEDGSAFGEDYTLVAVSDYLFSRAKAEADAQGISIEEYIKPYSMSTVSNLSSSRALRDLTESYGATYYASAVGEVNVTTKMKQVNSLIGGEGNGGVIYPALHYGRDAMVGLALMLSHMAHKKMSLTELRATYPQYYIAKNKIQLSDKSLVQKILDYLKELFANEEIIDIDGVKIIFEEKKQWVHLRSSNTEPIIRIYSEAKTMQEAEALGQKLIDIANSFIEKQ